MAVTRFIQKEYRRDICRRCINRLYGARLNPSDCRYGIPYPQTCPCCGKVHNIVTDLRFSGKLKLLARRADKTWLL